MAEPMDEMNYTPDIYTLIDEEGKELAFELLAGAASAGTEIAFYAGFKLQYTSIVMPVDKLLSGFITVVLAYFVFGEKVTKRSAIALALIGAGSVAIIM